MKRLFQRIHEKAENVAAPPVLIAAFGDSVTQGVMEHRMLDGQGVFHRLLQTKLENFYPTTTFSTLNAGVSGDSAVRALDRLDRDVIRHDPDLVLVAFGLNDSLDGRKALPQFDSAIRQIVLRVRQQTEADLILVTPPFMARCKGHRIHVEHEAMAERIIQTQNEGILGLYAEAIRKIAMDSAIGLADVHAEWQRLSATGLDTDTWLINGLNHPDARGHHLAGELIFQVILQGRES